MHIFSGNLLTTVDTMAGELVMKMPGTRYILKVFAADGIVLD
jgi:hypothetical protein